MALRLSKLLDEPEVLVESAIKKLENISGWQSTDVRLLAEIDSKVRQRLVELGLDPEDTTGPELYHALYAKLTEQEKSIVISCEELMRRLVRAHKNYQVYALRQSVAKDILRAHPPRKLMKQLNYRSVDSMIKRENVAALFAVLASVESPRWLNVFYKDISKLNPSDFETREISIVTLPAKLQPFPGGLWRVPLLGAVVVPESDSKIELGLNITQNINELRSESALIKLRNVQADFGQNLVEIVRSETAHPMKISHIPISWHTVFHHYGQRALSEHTEFFGPHLLHEDIKAHNVLHSLSKALPVLNWWQGFEHVAKQTEQGIVSLSLRDVLASKNMPYKERSLEHSRKSLWHEFINRYFAHPSVEQHFMQQLEPQTVPVVEIPQITNPEEEIKQMFEVGV